MSVYVCLLLLNALEMLYVIHSRPYLSIVLIFMYSSIVTCAPVQRCGFTSCGEEINSEHCSPRATTFSIVFTDLWVRNWTHHYINIASLC